MARSPLPPCPNPAHSYETINCGMCRADALVAGPDALAAFTARYQAAMCDLGFPPRYRAAALGEVPEVAAWVEQWASAGANCPSLLLMGNVGVGKTWQAFAALRGAATSTRPVQWVATTAADMYADLRPRTGHDTEAALRAYRDAPLLLIDDLGTAKASEWVEETTYRIIAGRYDAMLPAIYTTNVPAKELASRLGDRIASRLVETCTRVVMTGADRRRVGAA